MDENALPPKVSRRKRGSTSRPGMPGMAEFEESTFIHT
jgi:hypothetical protein